MARLKISHRPGLRNFDFFLLLALPRLYLKI
jgi:hypothetical protein